METTACPQFGLNPRDQQSLVQGINHTATLPLNVLILRYDIDTIEIALLCLVNSISKL
jgi:hypothetical protein